MVSKVGVYMEFEEILKRRRSVRRFTDQQVREETIIQIMNEARHAPTWANAQETRIYVAAKNTARMIRKEYKEASAKGLGLSDYSFTHREDWSERERKAMKNFERQIGFVPSSPLGKGFLTGTVKKDAVFAENDIRHTLPRFMEQENMDHNQALAQAVTEFAESHSLAAAQVALAWLLHQKPFIVPIPGTKTESRLQENMSAAYVELSDEEYKELDRILEGHTVIGARYSKETESLTDRS